MPDKASVAWTASEADPMAKAKKCKYSKFYEPPPTQPLHPMSRRKIAEGLASLAERLSMESERRLAKNYPLPSEKPLDRKSVV